MSATIHPDGSTVTVEPSGHRRTTISRQVDGVTVWEQVFAWSSGLDFADHDAQLADVVERMRAEPGAFRRWWLA